jgi:hypothetical protein
MSAKYFGLYRARVMNNEAASHRHDPVRTGEFDYMGRIVRRLAGAGSASDRLTGVGAVRGRRSGTSGVDGCGAVGPERNAADAALFGSAFWLIVPLR